MNKAIRVAGSTLVVMAFMVVAGPVAHSQARTGTDSTQARTGQTGSSVDNSKMNTQDRDKNSSTADQQKENRSDREITRQIRESVAQDKSLSTYAHNVKIVTQNGQVTLRGPVRSDDEKRAIESKATEVAGNNKVTNELSVKSQ